jgi:hypothetical protein
MKIDIPVHTVTIKDENSGEQKTITTLRSATEIAEMVEEMEKEIIDDKVTDKVAEALAESK